MTGSKDGQGKKPAPDARMGSTTRTQQQQKAEPEKPKGAVEIPSDLTGCSVKELKNILAGLSINSSDCFEKSDMI